MKSARLAWSAAITAFYGLLCVVVLLGFGLPIDELFFGTEAWPLRLALPIFVGGEALLLFLSVDTSVTRLKPKRHVRLFTLVWAGFASTVLFLGLFLTVLEAAAIRLEAVTDPSFGFVAFALPGVFVLFTLYYSRKSVSLEWLVNHLLRASVLELLVVVPAHLYVMHRGGFLAGIGTMFGIVLGIAILLMCSGPAVLALLLRRGEAAAERRRTSASAAG